MKTTIELPDDLVAEAKKVAIERKTTLRELVDRGLRREISASSDAGAHPLEILSTIDARVWRGIDSDAYVAEQRAGWG